MADSVGGTSHPTVSAQSGAETWVYIDGPSVNSG